MTGAGDKQPYGLAPNRLELIFIILTGVAHVTLELMADGMRGAAESLDRPQHYFNLAAVVAWGGYVAWRLITVQGLAVTWGMRREGFAAALKASAWFAIPAAVMILLMGHINGRPLFPMTFWLLIFLYPLWGFAQQFALQCFLSRNLQFGGCCTATHRAALTAVVFSMAHFPNIPLMELTFLAGLVFTWLFIRFRNLWAIGILHGILGAMAYYYILGLDPGAELIENVISFF
jgi:uncharacterized protein